MLGHLLLFCNRDPISGFPPGARQSQLADTQPAEAAAGDTCNYWGAFLRTGVKMRIILSSLRAKMKLLWPSAQAVLLAPLCSCGVWCAQRLRAQDTALNPNPTRRGALVGVLSFSYYFAAAFASRGNVMLYQALVLLLKRNPCCQSLVCHAVTTLL